MGYGKDFDYRKLLRDLEELRFRGGRLYAERVTAAYGGGSSTGEWTPAVDLYEEGDCYYLVAEVAGVEQSNVTLEVADRALGMLDIDANGLDEMDKRILDAIITRFSGGPVGLGSLAVAVRWSHKPSFERTFGGL